MRPCLVLLTHKLIHKVAAALAAALGLLAMAVGAMYQEVAAAACGVVAAAVPGVDLEEEAVGVVAGAWVASPRAASPRGASPAWTLGVAAWGRST